MNRERRDNNDVINIGSDSEKERNTMLYIPSIKLILTSFICFVPESFTTEHSSVYVWRLENTTVQYIAWYVRRGRRKTSGV